MAIDWELQDVKLTENDTWVEGNIHVHGSAGPIPVDVTKPFKTKTNAEFPIELKDVPFVGKVIVVIIVTLKPPKTVHVVAKITEPVEIALGEKDVDVA